MTQRQLCTPADVGFVIGTYPYNSKLDQPPSGLVMQVHIVEVGRENDQMPAMHYAILAEGAEAAVEIIRRTLAFGGEVRAVAFLPWIEDVGALDLKPGKPKLLTPSEPTPAKEEIAI